MILRLLRSLIRLVLNMICRFDIRGRENVPLTGGMILAANHIGFLDLILVYFVIDRTDLFIPVAEKWGKVAWIRALAGPLNMIFVDRFNPDLKAIRKMIALMAQGTCLIIAPEGTRSPTGALTEGKPGVAYLAARSGFPVVPVGITGTEDKFVVSNLKHLRKSNITLTGGKPFVISRLPNKDRDSALQNATDEIMCQIAALLPKSYRGAYTEHPRMREILRASK